MRTNPLALLGGTLLLVFFVSACKLNEFQDVDGFDYEAEFAIPLVDASISIQDLLDRSDSDLTFLTVENDGSFTLTYQDEAQILEGNEVLGNIPSSFPVPVPSQNTIFPLSMVEEINIVSATLKSGTLRFELRSNQTDDLNVTITFPGLIKNGQALQLNATLDYQGSTPVETSIPAVDLTGYTILTKNGDLEINYEAFDSNSQSVTVNLIRGIADNWTFDQLIGEWDQRVFPTNTDTVNIDLYNNQVEGELYFSDPRLNITVSNSFGVPVFVRFQQITVLTVDNEIMQFTGELMNDGFLVDAPGLNQQGETVTQTYTLNKSNSNIDEIFNSEPKKIWYALDLEVASGSGLTEGFILDESEVNVMISFELPIAGTAKGFSTENIVDVDLGADGSDALKEAQLKIITANAIPIDASVQVYLLNTAGNVVDSIFDNSKEIVVANAPAQTTFVELTPSRLANLRQSKKIKIRSDFSTIDNGSTPVVIKKDQELSLKMGLRATLVQ